jgi:hypothetical protein
LYSKRKKTTKETNKFFENFNQEIKAFHKKEFEKVANPEQLKKNKSDKSFFPSFYQTGYIIQLWNVAYYFNPYLDKRNWEILLEKYLKIALVGENFLNHYVNLQIMASDMSDSHAKAFTGMYTVITN